MYLKELNSIRKRQFDLENLINQRLRSNPSFLLQIKQHFDRITLDALQLQTSMLQQFKDIEFQISTMGIHLARKVLVPQQLSELSAFQAQFNIILEIQSDLEKLLKKKKWYKNTIELVIKPPYVGPSADDRIIQPILSPKISIRNAKRKIVIESPPIFPQKELISNLVETDSTSINTSPIIIESIRKKRVENMAGNMQALFSRNPPINEPIIEDIYQGCISQDVTIENITVNKQTTPETQSYTILDNPEYFSQEILPSATVDLSQTLPISSLSLSNTQTQKDLNFSSMLFDCSDNIPATQTTLSVENSPFSTQNFNSQNFNKNDTQNFPFSQSQEFILSQEPGIIDNSKCPPSKNKYLHQQTNNKYSILDNNRFILPNSNENIWNKQNTPKNFIKTDTNRVKNALFSNSSQDFSANKQIENSNKSKCFSQSHEYNSRKLIPKVIKSQPLHPDSKQLSILNYVSPPRCKSQENDFKNKKFNTQTKLKSFPSGKNIPNHPNKLKNQNPESYRKLENRPLYSMNILMIQRDEITNDLPTSLWADEDIPADIVLQLEYDLTF